MLTDAEVTELTKDAVDDPFYALGFLESAASYLGEQFQSERYTNEIVRCGEVLNRALTEAHGLKKEQS